MALQSDPRELDARKSFIGGSDANIIFSEDEQRLYDLWLEKRGKKPPEDLSDKLPVLLGCWTEPFNRQWFERLSGQRVTNVGEQRICRVNGWRRATLDGLVKATGSVFEAKHTSAFAKSDEVLERDMPQLQHNMAVTGHRQAVLSVIFGNHKFEIFNVAADWLYQIELLEAEKQLWECVRTGREPVLFDAPPAPRPIGVRDVCLEGSNAWASSAYDWLKHLEAAKLRASACTSIKSLVVTMSLVRSGTAIRRSAASLARSPFGSSHNGSAECLRRHQRSLS